MGRAGRWRIPILNGNHDRIPPGAVYGGRPSRLGNPYQIGPDGDRDEVCRLYQIHFHELLRLDPSFKAYVASLRNAVALWCVCRPLRCHLETVVEYLEDLP